MAWQVIPGHDNVETLTDMFQKPAANGGIQYPETRFSANGNAFYHGFMFCDLHWNIINRPYKGVFGEESFVPSDRDILLTQFGLSDEEISAPVTITILDNSNIFRNYNATAILLSQGTRAFGRWEGLTIRLNKLEIIPEEEL